MPSHKPVSELVRPLHVFLRRSITDFEAISWLQLPACANVEVFVQTVNPMYTHPPSVQYPVLQTYVDEKLLSFLPCGEKFAWEWLETTRGFPRFWVNDRELARRPWIHTPEFKCLDELCYAHPPAPQ